MSIRFGLEPLRPTGLDTPEELYDRASPLHQILDLPVTIRASVVAFGLELNVLQDWFQQASKSLAFWILSPVLCMRISVEIVKMGKPFTVIQDFNLRPLITW
jgi:hypothetical protein